EKTRGAGSVTISMTTRLCVIRAYTTYSSCPPHQIRRKSLFTGFFVSVIFIQTENVRQPCALTPEILMPMVSLGTKILKADLFTLLQESCSAIWFVPDMGICGFLPSRIQN